MKNIFKGIALLAIASIAISCNNSAKNEAGSSTSLQSQEENVVEDTRFKVELASNDQMQYDKNELKVPVGEPIVLTFQHKGKMDKSVMGHNFVLLHQNVDAKSFAEKAALAADTDYIPEDEKEQIIAHTKMIGGGESVTIEFTIDKAGEYEYLCTFPAHYVLMKGVLIAE